MLAIGLEDGVLLYIAKLMEEVLVENAVNAVLDAFQVAALVGDLGVGKKQRLFFHGDHLVGILHVNIPDHQHDLVEIPPFVGQWIGFAHIHGHVGEHVEMPDLVFDVVGNPAKPPLVKIFD